MKHAPVAHEENNSPRPERCQQMSQPDMQQAQLRAGCREARDKEKDSSRRQFSGCRSFTRGGNSSCRFQRNANDIIAHLYPSISRRMHSIPWL